MDTVRLGEPWKETACLPHRVLPDILFLGPNDMILFPLQPVQGLSTHVLLRWMRSLVGIEMKAFKHTLDSLPSLFSCPSPETRRVWSSGIDCQPASTPKTLRDFELSQRFVLKAQIQVSDSEGTEWTLSRERFSGSELNRTGVATGESQTPRQLGKQPVPAVPPWAAHRLRKASLQQCPTLP